MVAAGTLALLPFVARVQVRESVDVVQRRLAVDLLRIKPFAGAVMMGSAVFVMIGTFDALWALVHKDLGTSEWIANLGITLFALPLIMLGPIGGRLSQTVGPFKVATGRAAARRLFMFLYGVMPTGGRSSPIAMVHSIFDGLTVSSTGVAVGLTVPEDRQAGAQGVLGAAQAMAAGAMAVITGALYEASGRVAAYSMCAVVMVVLVAVGIWLARAEWSLKRPIAEVTSDDSAPSDAPLTSSVRSTGRSGQRPVKVAWPGPCSRKLATPMRESSEWNTSTNASRSIASPSASDVGHPLSIACLASRWASSAPPPPRRPGRWPGRGVPPVSPPRRRDRSGALRRRGPDGR